MDDAPPRWLKLQVPGYRLLLYRFDIEPESYTLYITDLHNVWVEFLPYQQIIQRADANKTCNIDPKTSLSEFYRFLEKLEAILAIELNELAQRSIKMKRQGMSLSINTKDPPPESLEQAYSQSQSQSLHSAPENNVLDWTFCLIPLEMTDPRFILVFQTLILGLVGVIDSQGQQISDLMSLLRKKDFHLRHLREEYHVTDQPRIHRDAALQFVPDQWKANWKTQRESIGEAGTADVEDVLTRSMNEHAQTIWGFHAHGCRWQGSMSITIGQSYSPMHTLPLIPSSPPALANGPNDGEITASSDDEPEVKKEQREVTPALTYPVLSSPLHSPHKRHRSDINPEEPPNPSPKKRMRQFSNPSSSLALDLGSMRRPSNPVTSVSVNTLLKRPSPLQISSPTATAVPAKDCETELEERKKELEARLAGKSTRASRPKRRF